MHPQRKHRVARLLTALGVFIATSAGLHVLARHQGWNMNHGWHHHDYYCDDAMNHPTLGAPAVAPIPESRAERGALA